MNDQEDRWPPVTSMFRPHDTNMIDVWRLGRIRFKVYAITSVGRIDPDLLEASRRLCADIDDDQAHGAGWITIHQTQGVCYTFANWWCQDSIVRRRGWVAPGHLPAALRRITDDVTTCVWEIPLEAAERDAWVRTMMSGSNDIDDYIDFDGSRSDGGSTRGSSPSYASRSTD